VNRGEYTRVGTSVVGSTSVRNPLGTHRRSQSGSLEGSQGGRVPTNQPGQWSSRRRGPRRSGRRRGPGRRRGEGEPRLRTSEHGRRGTSLRTWPLERPHGDAPGPRVVESGPRRTLLGSRRRCVAMGTTAGTTTTVATTAAAATTAPASATSTPAAPARPVWMRAKGRM
jgi:hypothetical protein